MAYDNTNRGAAWKKERKSDKSPSYSGTINVEGTEYELAVWKGDGDGSGKGKPDMKFQIKLKDNSRTDRAASQSRQDVEKATGGFDPNDPIPFAQRGKRSYFA